MNLIMPFFVIPFDSSSMRRLHINSITLLQRRRSWKPQNFPCCLMTGTCLSSTSYTEAWLPTNVASKLFFHSTSRKWTCVNNDLPMASQKQLSIRDSRTEKRWQQQSAISWFAFNLHQPSWQATALHKNNFHPHLRREIRHFSKFRLRMSVNYVVLHMH